MLMRLVAAGTRMPSWVDAGFADYAGRFGPGFRLEITEIVVPRRGRHADVARLRAAEGQRMLAGVDRRAYVTALEVTGKALSTERLAAWLATRLADGRDLVFLIGGPDGLDTGCLQRADFRWSLSPLTFPHGLARVMVAEQLYRAHSLLKGHPYHRA